MSRESRIIYLESKLPKDIDVEEKYRDNFNRWAGYTKNGVYHWRGVNATCLIELWLLGVLRMEGIKFKEE